MTILLGRRADGEMAEKGVHLILFWANKNWRSSELQLDAQLATLQKRAAQMGYRSNGIAECIARCPPEHPDVQIELLSKLRRAHQSVHQSVDQELGYLPEVRAGQIRHQ